MSAFVKSTSGKVTIVLILAALLVGGALTGYYFWYESNPKFCDHTIELGTQQVSLNDFLTEFADPDKAEAVTDLAALDLSSIGTLNIELKQGNVYGTVKLTVKDSKAPVVVFRDILIPLGQEIKPEDFVVSVDDLSAYTVLFTRTPDEPEGLQDRYVSVTVEDAGGNRMDSVCVVHYEWLPRTLNWEFGQTITKADLLLYEKADEGLLDQLQLDAINAGGVGSYEVTSTKGKYTIACQVAVVDTTGPELKLKEVRVQKGKKVKVDSFVESATDLSGEVTLKFALTPDISVYGTQTVSIKATDIYGNETVADTVMYVTSDFTGPKFSGLSTITVEKNTEIDFTAGVKAVDAVDGQVTFTYNAKRVDTSKAGTYYVSYTAKDQSGNETTSRRKVVVNPDEEDTKALVAKIADSLPNDPEAIRDYVRKNVRYSGNWGGDDPTWFGFTKKHGNCYVHAFCLRDLLEYKGWETKLIWVTKPAKYNKSHYWLLIKINGQWKHIDATPSRLHGKYSLMNDAQRFETLVRDGVQRDWDRTKWPACD